MISNEKNSKKLKKTLDLKCDKCDFITSNKNDYIRHTLTKKHLLVDSQCLSMEKTQKNSYACMCGKMYKDNSGLWRHKKKCIVDTNINNNDTQQISPELIISVLQHNKELQQILIEQNKTIIELSKNNSITNNNNTITNTNSNNKTFNLNFS